MHFPCLSHVTTPLKGDCRFAKYKIKSINRLYARNTLKFGQNVIKGDVIDFHLKAARLHVSLKKSRANYI